MRQPNDGIVGAKVRDMCPHPMRPLRISSHAPISRKRPECSTRARHFGHLPMCRERTRADPITAPIANSAHARSIHAPPINQQRSGCAPSMRSRPTLDRPRLPSATKSCQRLCRRVTSPGISPDKHLQSAPDSPCNPSVTLVTSPLGNWSKLLPGSRE